MTRLCARAQLKVPELKALAACEPPLAPETRHLCAGRLIALVEASGKAGAQPRGGPKTHRNPKHAMPGQDAAAAAAAGSAARAGLPAESNPSNPGPSHATGDGTEEGGMRENALLTEVLTFLATATAAKARFLVFWCLYLC